MRTGVLGNSFLPFLVRITWVIALWDASVRRALTCGQVLCLAAPEAAGSHRPGRRGEAVRPLRVTRLEGTARTLKGSHRFDP